MDEDKYVKVSDLAIAAMLSTNFYVDSIDRSNPKRVQFVFFGDEEAIKRDIKAFHKDEICVEPRHYFEQLKLLKQWIYSQDK